MTGERRTLWRNKEFHSEEQELPDNPIFFSIDVVNLYGGSIPISENIDAVCDTLDEHIPTGGRCFWPDVG